MIHHYSYCCCVQQYGTWYLVLLYITRTYCSAVDVDYCCTAVVRDTLPPLSLNNQRGTAKTKRFRSRNATPAQKDTPRRHIYASSSERQRSSA